MHDKNYVAGRTVLITGGTSGLGLELSKAFLSEGCKVYILGRNKPDSLFDAGDWRFVRVDFSDLKSTADIIKSLAAEVNSIDIVINNAGVLSPPAYTATSDGIEYTFQVNFLSHLVVNEILIRTGKVSPKAILVSVTSPVYKYIKPGFIIRQPENYWGFRAYAESKYYTLLTGKYFRKLFPDNEMLFFGFDPGTFGSGIARMQPGWFRNIYRIASPFMKAPGKPAAELYKILTSGTIIQGAVYSSIEKYVTPEQIYGDNGSTEFIDYTRNLIAAYLPERSE